MAMDEADMKLKAAAAAALAKYLQDTSVGAAAVVEKGSGISRWATAGRIELMRKTMGSLQSGG